MTTDLTAPEQSVKDWLYGAGKGLIASIPLAGNLCAELFALMLSAPLQQRQAEWQRRVAEVLVELQTKQGVDLDKLRKDPQFTDVLIQTTRIALTTAQEEKVRALRNAIYNVGLRPGADEFRGLFLSWVDRLTELHLRVLAVVDQPDRYRDLFELGPRHSETPTLDNLIQRAIPVLAGKRPLYDQIWSELQAAGLLAVGGLHAMTTGRGFFEQSKASELGRNFLAFIKSPMD